MSLSAAARIGIGSVLPAAQVVVSIGRWYGGVRTVLPFNSLFFSCPDYAIEKTVIVTTPCVLSAMNEDEYKCFPWLIRELNHLNYKIVVVSSDRMPLLESFNTGLYRTTMVSDYQFNYGKETGLLFNHSTLGSVLEQSCLFVKNQTVIDVGIVKDTKRSTFDFWETRAIVEQAKKIPYRHL